MNDKVALACLSVLALCVVAACVMMFTPSANHDAAEIVKLITAGVTGALAGKGVDELTKRSSEVSRCSACGRELELTEDMEAKG